MPAGKVLNPDTKDARPCMGSLLRTNGTVIPFINTKNSNLSVGDPVLYDAIPYTVNYGGNIVKMTIGILAEGFDDEAWNAPFSARWEKVWKKADENDEIPSLGLKTNWDKYHKYKG